MSQASDNLRVSFKAADDEKNRGLTTPEDVVRYDDIAYGPDSRWQSLDVYRPRGRDGETLPVIVSVHGGGWVYGDKETYQFYCMSLARRGFAVVNFTYRLAPEHKYPAHMEDVNAVFRWTLDNAAEYGFDRDNVFAVGDSAGGHMLGLYSCICTDPRCREMYRERFGIAPPEGFAPSAVGLNCGVYSIGGGMELMADLMPQGGTEEEMAYIQVVDYLTENFPPAFIMTSAQDFLQDQASMLAAKLEELKVPYVHRYYSSRERELPHVFHCNLKLPEGHVCNDEECAFFREFLKP